MFILVKNFIYDSSRTKMFLEYRYIDNNMSTSRRGALMAGYKHIFMQKMRFVIPYSSGDSPKKFYFKP